MNHTIVEVKDLYKTYQMGQLSVEVLKKISLNVNKGDFLSIMGPSGSGKSTLLYMMGGLDKITSGNIIVNGKEMSTLSDELESTIRRKDIGFIFQFYNLIPNLNVEENILVPILLDHKKKKDYMKKIDQILETVGLSDRRYHTPRELSGGQQQRVSIARALINDPEIILADEPTGNLDSKSSTDILNLLKDINKTHHKTIIMVTHSKESALYGNRLINLKDGIIVGDELLHQ